LGFIAGMAACPLRAVRRWGRTRGTVPSASVLHVEEPPEVEGARTLAADVAVPGRLVPVPARRRVRVAIGVAFPLGTPEPKFVAFSARAAFLEEARDVVRQRTQFGVRHSSWRSQISMAF